MSALSALHEQSLRDPDAFWLERASAIDWTRAPTKALDDHAAPLYRWFPDGELNTCANALDRHVAAGHGERAHDKAARRGVHRNLAMGNARAIERVGERAAELFGCGMQSESRQLFGADFKR